MTETDPSSLQQILSRVGWVPTIICPAATVVKLPRKTNPRAERFLWWLCPAWPTFKQYICLQGQQLLTHEPVSNSPC